MEKTTASLKLITGEPRKDGSCPVKIVIIKRGRNARIGTGRHCMPRDWDPDRGLYKRHPDLAMENATLAKLLADSVSALAGIDSRHPEADVYAVKKHLEAEMSGASGRPGESFTDYARAMAASTQNFSTRQHLESTIAVLHAFAGDVSFTQLDYAFCRRFEKWAKATPYYPSKLKARTQDKAKQRSDSTVRGYFRDIRKVWNEARKSSRGPQRAWLTENYPFADYELPKASRSKKTTFGDVPMDMLRSYAGTPAREQARDAFLLQFNIMGMRIRDVLMLEWSEVFDGYVNYDMNKNGKIKKIPLSDEAAAIIAKYPRSGRYVLPYLTGRPHTGGKPTEKAVRSAVDSVNTGLAKACAELGLPKITSHGSRRSLGWLLRTRGESVDTIQGLYGHADRKTTLDYLDGVDTSDADRVVKDILNKR